MLPPLHSLYLWKYVRLASEVVKQQGTFSDDDKQFLAETVEEQLHVLSNITIGNRHLVNKKPYLLQSAGEGSLPVYTEPDRAEPGDNAYLWDYLIKKINTAYPPSRHHLKLTVVDPIAPH